MADFGLSETIDTSKQYFRQDKQVVVRLSIKWLAPESINDGVFSEKTDVVRTAAHFVANTGSVHPVLANPRPVK